MNLSLDNKRVLVLAASKGLGRAIATAFAHEGSHVVITSRDESALEETANTIKQETGNENVHFFSSDITKEKDLQALVNETVETLGGVDILINNSGGPRAGLFEDMTGEDWQQAYELNLLSYVRTTQAVLPYMKKQQFGRIVNITSSSIKQALDGMVLSNTFRAGVLGLTKSLATELAGEDILVNTVGPGRIATDRVAELDAIAANKQDKEPEDIKKESEKKIPAGRYGEPEEFAKTVVFLASGANTYVTGQSLLVDGGLVRSL
ncbi:3-oxoacyl-[acyl-carrier protein] reductase [Geomicrobium sp. JCM 19037]|uniref:SDR family oxidoreductase n=1 Tax=unclassified Geomicrobium TaxID=2628951 RepID=UPI00045F1EC7|nr:SDR family oxidoreductase [Geomicrobium sp. JCM 19037]GAK01925.1 3-oxoacyl-[acyl-carrier protein] reductase [Geomicrobium sp. JCM 19037]